MPMSRKVIIAIGLAAILLGGLTAYRYWQQEYGPIDEGKIEREWLAGWSGPRYSRSQCLVRIDTKLGIGYDTAWNQWHDAFVRYAVNHEPRARFDAGHGRNGEIYLLFLDACERRTEIARAMVAYFQQRHGNGYVLTVRDGNVSPGRETLQTCERYWTDCVSPQPSP